MTAVDPRPAVGAPHAAGRALTCRFIAEHGAPEDWARQTWTAYRAAVQAERNATTPVMTLRQAADAGLLARVEADLRDLELVFAGAGVRDPECPGAVGRLMGDAWALVQEHRALARPVTAGGLLAAMTRPEACAARSTTRLACTLPGGHDGPHEHQAADSDATTRWNGWSA